MATRRSSFTSIKSQPRPITSWSISRYHDYKKCPRFFKHKHVDKMKDGGNAAMARGTAIHKFAELYLLDKELSYANFVDDRGKPIADKKDFTKFLKEWDKAFNLFKDEFEELKNLKAEAELQLTFTKDWASETSWDDWAGAWVRVKLDAMFKKVDEAGLIDFKTGRIYDDKVREQLQLYGIAGLLVHPDAKKIKAGAWYLDQDEIIEDEFHRKNLNTLIKDWEKKTKQMLTDTTYKEKPGNACTYCPFSKSKGGPCKY